MQRERVQVNPQQSDGSGPVPFKSNPIPELKGKLIRLSQFSFWKRGKSEVLLKFQWCDSVLLIRFRSEGFFFFG